MKLVLRNKVVLKSIISILIFITIMSSVFAQEYIALQGSAAGSGRGIGSASGQGNITVEIWGAPTGGSLLYNSSSDFWGALNNSRYDILLGNGSQPLSLNFSNTYYMEIYINERELDFNTSERQVFQSPVGNITVTTPIKTTNSLNINDFFNVTAATSAVRTNGTIKVDFPDADDAVNLTAGGLVAKGQISIQNYTAVPAFTVNQGFNVSGADSNLVTNGTILIRNPAPGYVFNVNDGFNISGATSALTTNGIVTILNFDTDDALNITGGGMVIAPGGNAFTIDNTGKVTVRTTDGDDALNVTQGMVVGSGPGGNDQFKVDNNGAVRIQNPDADDALNVTRGAMVVAPGASAFRVKTDGKVIIQSSDIDDALNISGGISVNAGNNPGSVLKMGVFGFQISEGGAITTQNSIGPSGNVVIRSSEAQALSVNGGFNVSGTTGELRTNGTITLITAANNIPTQDDALNISGGGASFGDGLDFMRFNLDPNLPLFTLKYIVNMTPAGHVNFGSSVNVSGQVLITGSDADDAVNLTKGGLTVSGAVVKVGDASSTTQHHVDVYDGGANKCSYITLYDESGGPHYFWTNTTGGLLTSNLVPISCDGEGASVGSQA